MKTNKSNEYVLGVTVTGRAVFGVLLQAGTVEPVVLHRMVRHRVSRAITQHPAMVAAGVDMHEASGNDFTLHIGDNAPGAAAGSELFLSSEMAALGLGGDKRNGSDHSAAPLTFEFELSEMLDECARAGYPKPTVAFSVPSSDVTHIELRVPEKMRRKAGSNPEKGRKKPAPEQLMSLLEAQHQGDIDEERVAFVPMTPSEDGEMRYLALVAKPSEPVAGTLGILRAQKDEPMPSIRLLDTESSLYLGIARMAARTSEASHGKTGHTLVVRTGMDDTLVMFVKGEQLHHYESMRSLTAFDSPETICSRVLLQQDEYGIDDVQDVIVLSEDHEIDLIESFRIFFPEVRVSSLHDFLPGGEMGASHRPVPLAVATVTAFRLLKTSRATTPFEEVNLLPRKYLRKKIVLPFTLPVLFLSVLLFMTAFFFGGRFVAMEGKIDTANEKLRHFPPDLENAEPRVLQARIDSLHAVHTAYTQALSVLDSLLVGSDRWSRGLEKLSRETARTPGLWVEGWHPGDTMVELVGSATSREKVVEFAERLNGDVEALQFSEIRDATVYSFTMQVPLGYELPQAALYLREKAAEQAGVMLSAKAN